MTLDLKATYGGTSHELTTSVSRPILTLLDLPKAEEYRSKADSGDSRIPATLFPSVTCEEFLTWRFGDY